MTKLPIHTLLDKDKKPFIPFVTAKCIPLDGTGDTVYDRLEALNNKEVVQPSVATEVTAVYNYQTLPISDVAPTEANQLVNKQYVDDSITSIDVGDVEGGGMPIICKDDISYSNPFVISTAEPGIYRVGGNDVYIRVLEGGSRNPIKIIDGLIYVLKKYEDAEIDEMFCFYTSDTGRVKDFIKKDNSFIELNSGNGEILRTGYNTYISGQYTYTKLPKSSVTPTEDEQFTNKKYVDDAIANNAGPAIDESVLLHYKGHVDTVEDLDSTGQPSGTLTDQYMGIDNTILGTDETAIAAIKELVGDAYFLGVYKSPTDYLIISSTDSDAFKDISFIKSGFGSTEAATSTYAFVIVDESKEHNVQICCNAGRSVAYLKTPSGSGTLRPSENYKGIAQKLKSVQLYAGANACLYGNVPNALNYVNTPSTGIFNVNSQGNFWTDQASGMTCLRLNFENNYIYNAGMQCLKSNGDGTLSWVLTDSIAQINDMRTVGASHEIYVCMPGYVWTKWNDTYSKSEIDEMLGNAEAVLTEVLEGTTV